MVLQCTECPKSFLARIDFGIRYLRNDAMRARSVNIVIESSWLETVQKVIEFCASCISWECSPAPPGKYD